MDIMIRIDLLKNSGQLSESNCEKVKKVIDLFCEKYNIVLTEENSATFITHLCMALGRIDRCEPVLEVDATVYESIKCEPIYNNVCDIVEDICNITSNIPETEKKFITIHITALLTAISC